MNKCEESIILQEMNPETQTYLIPYWNCKNQRYQQQALVTKSIPQILDFNHLQIKDHSFEH